MLLLSRHAIIHKGIMTNNSTLKTFLRSQLRKAGSVRAAAVMMGVTEAELLGALRNLGLISPHPVMLERWFKAA